MRCADQKSLSGGVAALEFTARECQKLFDLVDAGPCAEERLEGFCDTCGQRVAWVNLGKGRRTSSLHLGAVNGEGGPPGQATMAA